MSDTFEIVKAEPERDRYGRYVIHPANGGKPKSYTRATTIAETLDDRYNLEAWKVRTTALGIVQRPDLYAALASTPVDEKQKLNKLCDQAREAAAGSAGANLGTALHRFTERLNRGEEVTVPAPWDADIAAYRASLNESRHGIDDQYLERIVVVEKLQVAGMFDMLLRPPDFKFTTRYQIADLKTGATLDFSWCAIAVQLALYSRADTLYDPATKTHEAMPPVDQDKAIVIHLPAGKATCTLYEVDIAAGWEAAQHAMWARDWRKRKGALATPLTIVGGGASTRKGEEAPDSNALSAEFRVADSTPADVTKEKECSSPSVSSSKPSASSEPSSPAGSTADPIPGGLRAAPVTPTEPEEMADPDAVAALGRRFDQTTGDPKAWLTWIYRDAKVAGTPIGVKADPTVRKFEIGRALIRFAELGADGVVLRAALSLVYGDEVQTSIPLYVAVAALTIDEARRLSDIALALNEGRYAIIFTNDGGAKLSAA